MQDIHVLEQSVKGLIERVVELTLEGWKVTKDFPGAMIGLGGPFQVVMEKEDSTQEGVVLKAQKKSKGEILAAAREKKAQYRKEAQ